MEDLSCENEFICMKIRNHFKINNFALSLALKQRLGGISEMGYFMAPFVHKNLINVNLLLTVRCYQDSPYARSR